MPDETLPPDPPRAVRLVCPHCGVGIRVVPPADEVSCPSCGSSFHLAADTSTRAAEVFPATIGRFEVLARLGVGTFGTVYKARDPDLDRVVAVKVPRAGTFATAEDAARFQREAKAAARLQHPGIVTLYEVGADPPLIAGEFIDGVTLADRLTAGRPTVRESAELVAAVADALDFAHRNGVVHRDVKPANILLDADGKPHLTDFGLARRDDPEFTVSVDGRVIGTPAYMAPEQAAGTAAVDGRADVYSLGVVLYELLTGDRPFRGNQRMLLHQVIHDDPRPPRRLNDLVPRDLETVCLKCLAKAPGKRYATVGELAADLRRWLDGRPVLARRAGRVERLARWCRRNPAVAVLSAAVVLVLAAGAAVSTAYAVSYRRTAGRLDESLRVAERRAGELAVDKGAALCERGDEKAGVLWLARGLEQLDRTDGNAADRRYARVNLSLWGQHLNPRLIPLDRPIGWGPVRFLPDGKTFVALSVYQDSVGRSDAETGKLIRKYTGHPLWGHHYPDTRPRIRVSRDGSRVLVWGREFPVRNTEPGVTSACAWVTDTGETIWKQDRSGPLGGDTLHDFSPDLLYAKGERPTGTGRRRAFLVPIARDSQPVLTPPEFVGGVAVYGQFSPDGRVYFIELGKELYLWSVPAGRLIKLIRRDRPVGGLVAFSPDGREVLAAAGDGTIERWDARTGDDLPRLGPFPGGLRSLGFSPDGRWLTALTGVEGERSVWAGGWKWLNLGWPGGEPWPHPGVLPQSVDPTGRVGLRGDQLVNLATGERIGSPIGYSFGKFTPAGDLLLTFGRSGGVQFWDTASGRRLGPQVPLPDDWFSPSGDRLTLIRPADLAVMNGTPSGPSPTTPHYAKGRGFIEHRRLGPVEGPAERVTLWVQALTGMELDADGAARSLSADEVADRKQWLDALGGDPLPK